AALRRLSGVDELGTHLSETFESRADLLKAYAALSALDRIAWQLSSDATTMDALRALRDDVERHRFGPQMHRLRELWALEQADSPVDRASSHRGGIPDDLKGDLARLASAASAPERLGLAHTASVEALRNAALAGTRRWQEFRVTHAMTRRDEQIAEVAIRSYT